MKLESTSELMFSVWDEIDDLSELIESLLRPIAAVSTLGGKASAFNVGEAET